MERVIDRRAALDVRRDTAAACIRISGAKDRPEQHAQTFSTAAADLLPTTPARYAQDLGPLQARFAAVVVVDGSRLAAIAPPAAASVRPRRAGRSCRRTADRSAAETPLLCGAEALEVVGACAWGKKILKSS